MGTVQPRHAWHELLRWLRFLNTEIDLALDGRPGPIPLPWLEDQAESAYAERDRLAAEGPR